MSRQIKDQEGFEEKTLPSQNVIKIDNVNASDVNNIESGYIGLWTSKKNSKDKVFYTLPITYYYMVNHLNNENIQPTTHAVYDLDDHIANLNFIELKIVLEIKTKKINKQIDILSRAKDCINLMKNNSSDTSEEIISTLNDAIKNNQIDVVKELHTKEEYKIFDNNLNELNQRINELTSFTKPNDLDLKEVNLEQDNKYLDASDLKINKQNGFIINWSLYNLSKEDLKQAEDNLFKINQLFNNFKRIANVDSNDNKFNELEQNYFDLKMLFLQANNESITFNELEQFIENVKLTGVNIYYEE